MKIDQDLRDRLKQAPEEIVEVVLSCRLSAAPSEAQLAQFGFLTDERQKLADSCFIHGRIPLGKIESLSALSGIEAVSSATEAHIC